MVDDASSLVHNLQKQVDGLHNKQQEQGRSQNQKRSECDYDDNPTVLYQAIEAKEWDYAISLFDKAECEGESAVWVIRKETNGKLRWRLLPLHAAIIFGSPLRLIDHLVADYPEATQCKDDRGMLPLHLAFRNEGAASWEIIDELLTAYPQAIFVKDRKGRTPLECGIQLTQGNISSSMSVSSAPQQSNTFKSIVNVLDLYSQIVVSGERQKSQGVARKQVESRIAMIQETHARTLASLQKQLRTKEHEAQHQILQLRQEQQELHNRIREQEEIIKELRADDRSKELEQLSAFRPRAVGGRSSYGSSQRNTCRSNHTEVEAVEKNLFETLLGKCEELVSERQRITEVLNSEKSIGKQDEVLGFLRQCREWVQRKENVEEKKIGSRNLRSPIDCDEKKNEEDQ